jgi:hypothetical protein
MHILSMQPDTQPINHDGDNRAKTQTANQDGLRTTTLKGGEPQRIEPACRAWTGSGKSYRSMVAYASNTLRHAVGHLSYDGEVEITAAGQSQDAW